MHNLLRLLLSALVFITPFFVIPRENFFGVSKPFFIVIVAGLAAIVWIIYELRRGSLSMPRHMALVSIAAFVIVSGLASIIDSFRLNSVFSLLEPQSFLFALLLGVLVYLVAHAFRNRAQIFRVLLAISVVPVLLVLFQIAKVLLGSDIGNAFVRIATFTPAGSWNEFGLLCGLGAVLSASVISSIRRKTALWGIFFALFILSLFGLLIVNLQFAWILVGIFSILLFVYMFAFPLQRSNDGISSAKEKDIESPRRSIPVVPIVLIIVSFIFALLGSRVNPFALLGSVPGFSVFNSLAIYSGEARPAFMTTFQIGIDTLKSGQIFGAGPGKFSEAWNMFKPADINNTALWSTDFDTGYSTVLTAFVTQGVLGLLVWIFITVTMVMLMVRAIFKSGTVIDRGVSLAIVLTTLYGLVLAWLYPLGLTWHVVLFFMFGLLIAHGRNAGIIQEREYSYVKDPRTAFAAVLGLVAALLAVLSLGYLTSTQAAALYNSLKSSSALAANNLDDAALYASRSLALSPMDSTMRVVTDININRLKQYVDEINAAQSKQTEPLELTQVEQQQLQRYIQAPIQSASQAIVLDEKDYVNWMVLGNVYRNLLSLRVDPAYEEATKAYVHARELSPRNPSILLALAELERLHGDRDAAFARIDEALALKPDYTDAYFLRAQMHIENDSLDEAIIAAELGAMAARNNQVAYLQVGILKFNNNDYKGAMEALNQALAIDPQFANAQYFLARSYYELGRRDEARTIFEQLAVTNPDNKDIQEYLERLNSSGGAAASGTSTDEDEEDSNS